MTDRDIIERLRCMKLGSAQRLAGELDDLCLEAAEELEKFGIAAAKAYGVKKGRAVCLVSKDGDRVTDIYDVPAERMPHGYNYAEELAEADATIERLTAREQVLVKALRTLRGLINEGGAPRYTITPGAAFNSFVEEDLDPLLAALSDGGGK